MIKYDILEKNGNKYILFSTSQTPLAPGADVLTILSAAYEGDTQLALFCGEAVSDDFLRLQTGIAGEVMQNCVNYHIKAAFVIEKKRPLSDRFKELIYEMRTNNTLRFFADKDKAEEWLLG